MSTRATTSNGNLHPIADQLSQRVATTSDRMSPRRFLTGLSSPSPSPVFHPNLQSQSTERTPSNSPIVRVNTPSDLTGTQFDSSGNIVSSSSTSSGNNTTASHSVPVNSTISNVQSSHLDVSSHVLKVNPSLTVSTGSSTVLAGSEIPAYVTIGTYNSDFHVGSNTTDDPNITKILEVSQSLYFNIFFFFFDVLSYTHCFHWKWFLLKPKWQEISLALSSVFKPVLSNFGLLFDFYFTFSKHRRIFREK